MNLSLATQWFVYFVFDGLEIADDEDADMCSCEFLCELIGNLNCMREFILLHHFGVIVFSLFYERTMFE